jgi:two-component system, cell cycle response regulator DivK
VKTVLIVDDVAAGRDVYARALEAGGYRVVQAEDGAVAVRMATDEPPDLILMNVSIPLVNGIDATEILKSHPATEKVPILMVTGHVSANVQDDAWAAGCDDYFCKPVPPTQILAAVAEHLGGVPGE